MTATVSAPSIVPSIVPRPPNKLVPPSTTAAMTSSSKPPPAFEEPLPRRPAIIIPAIAAGEATQRVDRKRDLLGVDARAADRFCVCANAGHIAAEGGFIEDKKAQSQHDDGDDRRPWAVRRPSLDRSR